ncbi:Bax inhibitor-1/YccA family protein [Paucilactobacillus suebicus]|uniref:Integral membrane protein n=1 Tax=Paucilactobacillus suebicus DSM 5007 = KCTC 3549 TaxID=1423807 RepID=A0A0R1W6Z9_9LACO|nr:Bax inhibitor-1/YccA family protein [Paucilactobacillus suebicus]KRM13247.1 integral membrane protein [Paucilactobacillus suebicus DSM 5007 = KCTC 3549]
MNNFNEDYSQTRREVGNEAGLTRFMSRMYGNMTLAVLVSALSSFLTLSVFRTQVFGYISQHPGTMWIVLLLPIALSMGISFRATRNPVASFIMLMVLSVIYGVVFSLICAAYTSTSITAAFVSSAAVFLTMTIYGNVTKRDLSKIGAHAIAALVALIIASVINMFLQSAIITYIFSYIAVIIFTVLTAWDTQKMKQIYLQYGNQVSVSGLAVLGALQLYLDFVNLFISFLQIFGMSSRD